ncbi:MAG TPA: hypothetical protein VE650_16395, partial [Acetobacteraceae bacterium]|nr:hypothetical protein [Acetobacteraceae bacterium]
MSTLRRFNPYDLSDETLRAIATGREHTVARILAVIDRNAEGGPIQHLQIVAPRGYGKSFLLRLVRAALSDRSGQGPAVRVAALPEEQANVDAPHRLLNEIERLLAGRPPETLMGSAFQDEQGAWDEAIAALDAAVAVALPPGGGVVVAMVENFDALLADVFKGKRDQSRLRAWMARQDGRLMLLATSTRRADAEYERRLFHATGVIELDPWREEACIAFFEKLRGRRAAGPMPADTRAKALAVANFIGGSPRMATVLADVLESNDSLQAAGVLDALVDELTPYYKHRIESLPRQSRSVLDALLRGGEPATQSELARRLRTVQSRIARPFQELRFRGEVVGQQAAGSAEMLYRVADRLMAHYYRKRHFAAGEGDSSLEAITEFLASFFSLAEKTREAERLRGLGRPVDAAVLERLATAEKDAMRLSAPDHSADRAVQQRPTAPSRLEADGVRPTWLSELAERVFTLTGAGQIAEAVDLCREGVRRADGRADLVAASQARLS